MGGTEIKRLVKSCWESEGVLHVPFSSESWTTYLEEIDWD